MIGVVTNPNARSVMSDPLLPRRLAQIGGRTTMVVETHDLDEVSQAVREFASHGVDMVASCGGDGTNLTLLTQMIRVYGVDQLPALAILRGGTVNTIAGNLGLRGSPEDILTRLVACRNRGMEVPSEVRSLLCINGVYGFFFGAAFPARFYEAYYRGPAGVPWATWLAARVTFSSLLRTPFARRLFEVVPARITVDGTVLENHRWTLLVAATLMNAGLNIRITYRAMERADRFQLVASGLSPFHLARQLHRTFLARPLEGQPHFDLLGSEARIEFDRPEPFIIDGDLFQASRVDVRIGPRVRLSTP
jgi:diacylglycerol kinase (ATP)